MPHSYAALKTIPKFVCWIICKTLRVDTRFTKDHHQLAQGPNVLNDVVPSKMAPPLKNFKIVMRLAIVFLPIDLSLPLDCLIVKEKVDCYHFQWII